MEHSNKPNLILDQHFRKVEELFSESDYERLQSLCSVTGGLNWPMPEATLKAAIPQASFLVSSHPKLDRDQLGAARNLKAIVEVSGTFQSGLDYSYCFENGIEVLSCSPGFNQAVAEMTLGLMLAGARGIVSEHEKFSGGSENWLDDNIGTDFTLHRQAIGFVGFGAVARETARLLKPFGATFRAFDPWLANANAKLPDVNFCTLEELISSSRCIIVAAAPTDENFQLLSKDCINKMRPGTLVVVISRSHLVDFEALLDAADQGHIRVATDVFPTEPVHHSDPMRLKKNVIFSPHRAAAVEGGRHPIGRMIVHDLQNIINGSSERQLQAATPERIHSIIRAPAIAAAGGD